MCPFQRKKNNRDVTDKGSPEMMDENISKEDLNSMVHRVTDTLDLHGFFPEQIPQMIRDFIENAHTIGLRRLRIVHGKGKSRLKWEVHQVLKAEPCVESFGDAPPDTGGWGATVVLLKEEKESP
jgi:DNA-nicking Smr family endonuclease